MNIQTPKLAIFASFAMFLAILFDAMGAHALEKYLSAEKIEVWAIAGRYLLVQSLALLVLSLIKANRLFNISTQLIAFGMLAFSLSLYTLCFFKIKYLGLITPLGGLLMMIGWLGIMISLIKK